MSRLHCNLTPSDFLTLKQLGFSEAQIDSAISEIDEDLPNLKSIIRFLQLKGELKKTVSFGWKPSKDTISKLEEIGCFPDLVDLRQAEYLFEISQMDKSPRDLDAYFIGWLKNRLAPQEACNFSDWAPGRQVKQWQQFRGISPKAQKDFLKLYTDLVHSRNDTEQLIDHDLGFRDFITKWIN